LRSSREPPLNADPSELMVMNRSLTRSVPTSGSQQSRAQTGAARQACAASCLGA
jgi:hypothetical protein